MIQIKTTRTSDMSEPVALSHWQRMVKEPVPWFVLAVHLDERNEPDAAYLVHIDQAWCARVLKRLRELGNAARNQLHRHTLNVSWTQEHKLASLHGDDLIARIRAAIPDGQHTYVIDKLEWFRTVGYDDTARLIRITYEASSPDEFWEQMSDIGAGLRTAYPGAWKAKVLDTRFGIESSLTEFDCSGGEMHYRAPAVASAVLEISSAACKRPVQFSCEVYRASSIFPFLPEQFDKIRLASSSVECMLQPRLSDTTWGLSTCFSMHLPVEKTLSLGELRSYSDLILMLSKSHEEPLTVRALVGAKSVALQPGVREELSAEHLEVAHAIDHFVTVCDAFEIPETTYVALADILAQANVAGFLRKVLTAEIDGERLEAHYREVVPEGSMFATTAEYALFLDTMNLACFIGVYGAVTASREHPRLGSRVTVEKSMVIVEKVLIPAAQRGSFDVSQPRQKVLAQLHALGCKAISMATDESTRRRPEAENA